MDDLAEVAEELVTYLQFHAASAADSQEPDEMASGADAACTYYQAVAICELLLDAEIDAFFHHMLRSARARRWLQQQARTTQNFPPKPLRASNTKGFFAALVANDFDLAKDIADLSPRSWEPKFEYEEDFWYAHFLHRFVAGDAVPRLNDILAEYGRALEGDEPARFRLCGGVLAGDQDATLAAFADLIDERGAELDEMRKKSLLATDDTFPPFAAVFVEGLAWLRLLTRAGVETESDYEFCPSLARGEQYAPYTDMGVLGA